jgi:DNA-binding MarR family transcriptional regulator
MGTPQNLDDLENRAWLAHLRFSVSLFGQLHRELLREAGLSLPDYEVMEALIAAPKDRLRAYELGVELGWEKSRLSHHLKRMETRGMVERITCESDGRGMWVTPTEEGRSAFDAARPVHAAAVRRLFTGSLTHAQLEAISELTEKVIANMPDPSGLCDS